MRSPGCDVHATKKKNRAGMSSQCLKDLGMIQLMNMFGKCLLAFVLEVFEEKCGALNNLMVHDHSTEKSLKKFLSP